ncbi:MAG TPA: DEAD/DEAH box helicase [Kiritimatiellia bacterium]|nr:DEAD/DEAH box helicase [Kiritimatiellia bacterium]HMP35539.1 DEAD/DEAH box helicase [Kiritimatiellia bacterium]
MNPSTIQQSDPNQPVSGLYINRDSLVKWSGPHQHQEGKRLFESGAVTRMECEGNIVRAVLNFGSRDMVTRFKILKDGSIENLCPCRDSRERGLVCAHAMALGFAYVNAFSDSRTDRSMRIQKRREKHARTGVEYGCIRRSPVKAPHVQPAQLRIKLETGWRASAPAGVLPISVWVHYRDKKTRIDKAPVEVPFAFAPEQEEVLYCIEDIVGLPMKGQAAVTVDDFIELLDLTPADVLYDGETNGYLAFDASPVVPMLSTSLDEDSGDLLLTLDMDWPKSGKKERSILPGNNAAYIHWKGTIRRLASALPRDFHALYEGPMRIPRVEIMPFLHQQFPHLEKSWLIEHNFPQDRIAWGIGTPDFRVVLSGDYERMRILLHADYDGLPGPLAGSPDSEPPYCTPDRKDHLRYLRRDLEQEQQALAWLRQRVATHLRADGEIVVDGAQSIMDILATVLPALKGRGWQIAFEGWLEALKQGVSWIVPEVECKASGGEGWFDCNLTFRDSEGQTLDPALIQAALLKGDGCVQQGDRIWLMDRHNMQTLQDILDECDHKGAIGHSGHRLDAIHAGFIRNSVSALSNVKWSGNDAFSHIASAQNREVTMEPVSLSAFLEKIMRGYQKEGVSWLRFLERCGFCGILADEMGLGKTIQALAWLTLERVDPRARNKPAIVVCPTSLLENWAEESRRFTPDLRVHVIHGQDRKKALDQLDKADLIITSYALLRRDIEHYHRQEFSVAILDEAQHIKNHSTQNARAAKKLRAVHRLVLTGTPVENGVTDLWSIVDFLMPGYLGHHQHFRRAYEMPIAAGSTQSQQVQQRLRQKVHPFLLRRLKRDVAKELPERIDRIAYCTMTPDQRAVYRQLLESTSRQIVGMVTSQGFTRSRFMILKTLTRLRQVCCHLDLLKMPELQSKNPSGKLDLFMELLDEAMDGGHRVLVFSQFVSMLHIIRDELNKRKTPYCYLDGSTVHRWEEVQKFNETDSIPLFLISLKAGGTGLNLTGADMVIHFDPWWNPAVEDQATDRAHRIGQHKTVYNVKLITRDSIEEKVLELQKRKRSVIDATLSADVDIIRSLSWEDVQDLLQL